MTTLWTWGLFYRAAQARNCSLEEWAGADRLHFWLSVKTLQAFPTCPRWGNGSAGATLSVPAQGCLQIPTQGTRSHPTFSRPEKCISEPLTPPRVTLVKRQHAACFDLLWVVFSLELKETSSRQVTAKVRGLSEEYLCCFPASGGGFSRVASSHLDAPEIGSRTGDCQVSRATGPFRSRGGWGQANGERTAAQQGRAAGAPPAGPGRHGSAPAL